MLAASNFRALHLALFAELFVQMVGLARAMGLAKLDTIAVDGTKIKANAGRHKAMSYARMQSAELELKGQFAVLTPGGLAVSALRSDKSNRFKYSCLEKPYVDWVQEQILTESTIQLIGLTPNSARTFIQKL